MKLRPVDESALRRSPAAGRNPNALFPLISAEDFQNLPDLDWLVKNVIPASGLACIFGQSGVGKSFNALALAAAVALGLAWFSHPTRQCGVVYVALEGKEGFRRRIRAWEIHHDRKFPVGVGFLVEAFSLDSDDDVGRLAATIREWGGAGLVIIDTLNKAAAGADENSSSDMGRLIGAAAALQRLIDGVVLLIHHPGKDSSRGLRGHSSLIAALDTVIELERDGSRHYWTLVKSKDGQDGITHAFDLSVVEIGQDDSDKAITSCAVTELEGGREFPRQVGPRGTNQKMIFAGFHEALRKHQMLAAGTEQGWPEGIPFDEAVNELKGVLVSVDQNHRQIRTKEALEKLVENGYLDFDGAMLTPVAASAAQGGRS